MSETSPPTPALPSAPPPAKEPLPPHWSELLARLAEQYPLVKRTEDWLCLGWPASNPEQTLQVTCLPVHGLMRLFLTADICVADEVSERDALELAAKVLLGGVVVQAGVLSLRHVFTEGRFTVAHLHEAIFTLRGNAVRFRDRLLQRRHDAAGKVYDDFAY